MLESIASELQMILSMNGHYALKEGLDRIALKHAPQLLKLCIYALKNASRSALN